MKKTFLALITILGTQTLFAQNYTNAESVEYDTVNNQWLVSNGTRIIADDGNGNLTYFGSGDGAYGSEIIGNTLFVSTGTSVKGYDLTTAAEIMDLAVSGAGFLNGMTNDGTSTLYTTDFSNNRIYAVDVSDVNNPVATIIVPNTEQTPNGILYDNANNRLIYTTWTNPARIKAVDLNTNMVSDITTTNVGQIDGIDDDADGNYYVSSWSPDRITKYNNDFSSFETLSTPGLNSPADVGISKDMNVIGIPMFSDVIFVDLTVLSVTGVEAESNDFGISSNPITASTFAQFTLKDYTDVSLDVFDINGKLVSNLLTENDAFGIHRVLFAGLNLDSGMYFLVLKTTKGSETIQVVIE